MGVKDRYGHALTGASATAADLYQQALDGYHCYVGQPFPLLKQAVSDSPGFVMAHALMAYMTLVGGDASTARLGVAAFEAASALPVNDRERGHLAAIERLILGRFRDSGRVLEDLSIAYPRDVLALQAGQLTDFITGDSRMLRDRIARALPAWTPDMPNHHALLGMYAFGLEETGLYDRAEAAGREAVALEPHNNWARHAVAHVMEMQNRRAEGVAWLTENHETWSRDSFFQVHNWWHLALFHLGLGQVEAALAVFDDRIYPDGSGMAVDMVDAAALLWRLKLEDVAVSDRWQTLADRYATQTHGLLAFDDLHAVMAFMGAGRAEEAEAVIAAMAEAAMGEGDNAAATREAGLAAAQAIVAFERGDAVRACDLLRSVRNRAACFGGSHAQRDVLDLTLIAAARHAGETHLERALLAERARANPLAA